LNRIKIICGFTDKKKDDNVQENEIRFQNTWSKLIRQGKINPWRKPFLFRQEQAVLLTASAYVDILDVINAKANIFKALANDPGVYEALNGCRFFNKSSHNKNKTVRIVHK